MKLCVAVTDYTPFCLLFTQGGKIMPVMPSPSQGLLHYIILIVLQEQNDGIIQSFIQGPG